jgi:PTH1 family peptidyl-tRNA hydrolase
VRVIAGLGNPGDEYRESRHNAGFLVVAGLARTHAIRLAAGSGGFVSGTGRVAGQAVLLVLPQDFMNASGPPVARALGSVEAVPSDLLVVCDDIALPLGRLRLRASGSDGGHRGLRSIVQALGTEEFARLRLGVGAPAPGTDAADHVLDGFGPEERGAVTDMVSRAVGAIELLLARGIGEAMNVYNRVERSEDGTGPGEDP